MGKFLVRLTIIATTIYFALAFYVAQFYGVDILYQWHTILFELCIVIYAFSEGKYHCRHIKYCALSIMLSDIVCQTDNHWDYLTITAHNLILIGILALGMATSATLAIRHFIQVLKLKRIKNGNSKSN